jgi:hypothetical protein
MKRIVYALIFFSASGFLLSSFFSGERNKIRFQTIWYGKNSGVFEKKAVIISSAAEFKKEWDKIAAKDFSMPDSVPVVDFKTKKIIFCYAGDQTNGIQIDSTIIESNTLTIYERNISLGPDCHEAALLVTPFEIIEVTNAGWKTVMENSRVKVEDCK